MIARLAVSLALTLVLEGCFGYCWGLRGRDLYLLLLVNLLTNPVVVLTNALTGLVLPLELGAVAVEGALYRLLGEKVRCPWLFAVCVNTFSYCAGIGIQYLI